MVIAPVYGMKGLLSSSLFICRYAHKSLPFVSFDMKMPPSEISSTGLFTGASAANARRGSSPRHRARAMRMLKILRFMSCTSSFRQREFRPPWGTEERGAPLSSSVFAVLFYSTLYTNPSPKNKAPRPECTISLPDNMPRPLTAANFPVTLRTNGIEEGGLCGWENGGPAVWRCFCCARRALRGCWRRRRSSGGSPPA